MPSRVAFLVMLAALARWGLAYDILATTVITHTVWTTCLCHETAMTTAYSTCIDLGAATLTGVTIKPVSSPSTCYQFPTPLTALMPMALPLNQVLHTDATDLVFFYVGDNSIAPKYLGNPVASYTPLLDLSSEASSSGHLAMTLPEKRVAGYRHIWRSYIQYIQARLRCVIPVDRQLLAVGTLFVIYLPDREARSFPALRPNFGCIETLYLWHR